jgi:hypothetical protein
MNRMNDKKDLRIGDVVNIQGLKTTVIGFERTSLDQGMVCTPFGSFDKALVKRLNERVDIDDSCLNS